MNEKEKKEFYIAMCQCCLIAQTMKTCPLCRFNVGLTTPNRPVETALYPIWVPVAIFAMSEQC